MVYGNNDRQLEEEIVSLREKLALIEEQHRHTEQEMHEHLHFLQVLLDSIPTPIFYKDTNCIYIGCNRAFGEYLGLSKDQIIGKTVYDVSPADLADLYHKADTQLFEQGGVQTYESQVKHSDGTIRDVVFNKAVFRDIEGKVAGIIGTITDITELKQAEKGMQKALDEMEKRVAERTAELARSNDTLYREVQMRRKVEEILRQSEEKYRNMVESLGEWIWEVDTSMKFRYVSPKAVDITGYEPYEMEGRMPFEFMPEWERSRVKPLFEDLFHNKKPLLLMQNVIKHRNGNLVYLEVSGSPLFDDQGNFRGYLGIGRDITQRKHIEEERMKLADHIKMLLQSTDEGMYGINTDGLCTFINRSASRMLGYHHTEVLGKSMHNLIHYRHPDGRPYPVEDCCIDRAFKNGVGCRVNNEVFWRKDGTPIPVEYSSYPVINHGVITGAVVTFSDITERKKYEEALKESKAETDLYIDLMSHDINNMNQIALTYLEMAIEKLRSEGTISGCDRILLSKPYEMINSSSGLIGNVSKLQRVRAGDYKLAPVDIGSILEEIKAQNMSIMGRKISINLNYDTSQKYCVTANELLKDVFYNLVTNAIKHSTGEITIDIGINRTFERRNEQYTVTIADNGPGITDELKSRIFGRMQRGPTKSGGTGLGLFLVHSLVRMFHGRVWVEDRVPEDYSKGSKFVVQLPVYK